MGRGAVIAAETYTELVTNLPHIGAEITWDIILEVIQIIVLIPIIRWAVQQHDHNKHNV